MTNDRDARSPITGRQPALALAVVTTGVLLLAGRCPEAAEEQAAGLEISRVKADLWRTETIQKWAEAEGRTASDGISIVIPGKIRAVFYDGYGDLKLNPPGLGNFYDLQDDPEQKHDLASPFGGGLLRTSVLLDPQREHDGKGHKPSLRTGTGKLELLEANPVRAIIRLTWKPRGYGTPWLPANPDTMGEETYAVYAPDKIYWTGALLGIDQEVKLEEACCVLHTSQMKFSPLKEGWDKPWVPSVNSPWTFIPHSADGYQNAILHVGEPGVVNQHDGSATRCGASFLLVMYEESIDMSDMGGNRGNQWLGYNTILQRKSGIKGTPIAKGQRLVLWHALMRVNHEISDGRKAMPCVEEYRSPGAPKCEKGGVVGDGFDEERGCYLLSASDGAVDFTLSGVHSLPAFEITGWKGGVPRSIKVNGKDARLGVDYLGGAEKGRLLLQIRSALGGDARIHVAGDGSEENEGFFSGGAASQATAAPPGGRAP